MNVKKITNVGVMTGLALLLMIFIKFPLPIPFIPSFLLYEPGDIPILILSFLYGPVPGLVSALISSVLMALLTGAGGPYGAFMHFLATGTLVATAGYIYKKFHSKRGAIIGLITGSVAMTLIMIPANLIVTPIYLGVSREQVMNLLPGIVPFNIVKALLNSGITLLAYKRLANFLRAQGLISTKSLNSR